MKTKIIHSIWILSLVVISCLSGCSSTKKLEKSKLDSSIASNTDVTKKTDETQTGSITDTSVKTQDKNTSKVKETKVTDYDPTKPIVPGTGKPPVVKETITTEKEETQEVLTQKLNLQIDYTRQLKQTIDSQSNVITKLKAKTETEVKKVGSWQWYFFAFGCFGILVGILEFLGKLDPVIVFIKKVFRR